MKYKYLARFGYLTITVTYLVPIIGLLASLVYGVIYFRVNQVKQRLSFNGAMGYADEYVINRAVVDARNIAILGLIGGTTFVTFNWLDLQSTVNQQGVELLELGAGGLFVLICLVLWVKRGFYGSERPRQFN